MRKGFFIVLLVPLAFFFPARNLDAKDDNLSVALTGKYPPFSMYAPDGRLVGFDVDVSLEIGKRIGREVEFVTTEWDGILAGLLSGKYDAIIGSMAITPERQKKVDFSTPYYESGAQLFIHKNLRGEISSIEDCGVKRIGVVLGETFEHFLGKEHPGIPVRTYKSTVDIFQDVENGRLAGFVSDRLLGAYQIRKTGKPFIATGDLLYRERMAIPVVKERKELLAEINSALKQIKLDGTLEDIENKWFALEDAEGGENKSGQFKAIKKATVAKMLGKGFMITLLVALASIVFGFIIALPSGIILNNPGLWGHSIVRAVNDFIRGTPVLIQLFFVYYGLGSKQVGLNLSPISAAIITLSVNASAYMAEVVRSGLMAVDPGQTRAARALGFTKSQIFVSIVWPQAFRIAIPPLMNSVVALLKDTALVSVISVSEVIKEAQSIISVTFDPVKYYFIVALMFFIVTFPLMKLSGMLERKIKEKGFVHD